MKMYFYRGRRPNFGDELNVWLWPRLLPGFFDADERELFIGVGSTLFDFLPPQSRKIVFGAGYGGYTAVPAIDERWRFYFVRGRLTAAALGLDARLGVGDAAILVRSCVLGRPGRPTGFRSCRTGRARRTVTGRRPAAPPACTTSTRATRSKTS